PGSSPPIRALIYAWVAASVRPPAAIAAADEITPARPDEKRPELPGYAVAVPLRASCKRHRCRHRENQNLLRFRQYNTARRPDSGHRRRGYGHRPAAAEFPCNRVRTKTPPDHGHQSQRAQNPDCVNG